MSTWVKSIARMASACADRNCRQALKDLPDGRGGHGMAEADQLALYPSVAPAGILPGYPQHQNPDCLWRGWSAWSSVWVGPAVGDELGVPAQQRSR